MLDGKFNEDDKQKLIQFLNIVAKKAQFSMNTQEIIEYFKLLNFMQSVILPKVDKNIAELVEVIEPEEESKEE